jgi:REP element-mobilizing transposase RayT
MPRHARIDIPGLLQHVIVRGIERCKIFLTDEDREDFVARLSHLLGETRTVCYAWAMLDNHVHLLLMPTEQLLSRFMRRLLTGYAVSFNQRHKRSGHLFQNRYKSIVCDGDVYLTELVRYIHLNPVRANVISDLDGLVAYRWCGHRQMLGAEGDQLIQAEDILALFARRRSAARKAYLQFMDDGLQKNLPRFSRGGRKASQLVDVSLTDQDIFDDRILGGGGFVERVLAQVDQVEAPKSLEGIVESVCTHYGLDTEELSFPNKERTIASAKAVICYLATRRYRLPGIAVAQRLVYTSSAVSHAAKRGRILFEGENGLRVKGRLWVNIKISATSPFRVPTC